jgi:hypothetical protein
MEQWLYEVQVTFRRHLNNALPGEQEAAQRLFQRTYRHFREDYHHDRIVQILTQAGHDWHHANDIAHRLKNFHQTVLAFDPTAAP